MSEIEAYNKVKAYSDTFQKLPNNETLCPRCGENILDEVQVRNALSRHERGVYICSSCGYAEAMLDINKEYLPAEEWWVMKKDA